LGKRSRRVLPVGTFWPLFGEPVEALIDTGPDEGENAF
jgi:hypothetical protein